MKIKHIEQTVLGSMADAFSARPAEKSKKKLKELYSKIRHMLWDKEQIEDYVKFTYEKHQKVRDRFKRSSIDYFIAILTNRENIRSFKDYVKHDDKKATPTDRGNADIVVTYKGNEFILLEDIDEGEIYFHEDIEKEKFIFVVRDLSENMPRLMYLKTFNKKFPSRKISRSRMNQKARKMV
jgi:hypothetical protein